MAPPVLGNPTPTSTSRSGQKRQFTIIISQNNEFVNPQTKKIYSQEIIKNEMDKEKNSV